MQGRVDWAVPGRDPLIALAGGDLKSALGLGEQGRKFSEIKLKLSCWHRFAVSLLREAWSLSKLERGKRENVPHFSCIR